MALPFRLFLWVVLVVGVAANATLSLTGGDTAAEIACGAAAVTAAAVLAALRLNRRRAVSRSSAGPRAR
ncbi:hypothetical protein [Streptomyces avicenniae]|uniref:hypothetical protein n=1 Tax=Streptomyces avicenniae TaxID=500153 RepID=UPI00069C3421|nr:hypothetical protein [Streptomyces avicenniae]